MNFNLAGFMNKIKLAFLILPLLLAGAAFADRAEFSTIADLATQNPLWASKPCGDLGPGHWRVCFFHPRTTTR